MTSTQFHTIIEPFRIKSVEPIRMTTVAKRQAPVLRHFTARFQQTSRTTV